MRVGDVKADGKDAETEWLSAAMTRCTLLLSNADDDGGGKGEDGPHEEGER